MPERKPGRALWMGLATVTGWRKSGFFIPHRYAGQLPGPGERGAYDFAEALFAGLEGEFATLLQAIESLRLDIEAIGEDNPPEPRWNQSWFPRLDAAAAYAMTRRHSPRRIVEIGSGHSTRFFARAVRDGGLTTKITAIDPRPRAVIAGLDIDIIESTVHDAGPEPFAKFAADDFVVIDSSHILMPGSDVDYLFGRILPGLPAGAIVHIHDIFLPDDYPANWDWRGYNEQLGVLALLQGGGYAPLFASHYVATRMADSLSGGVLEKIELVAGAVESSLWLRKTS